MEDKFEDYAVSIDNDVLHQDFDAVDLYGDIVEEENTDSFGDDLEYE